MRQLHHSQLPGGCPGIAGVHLYTWGISGWLWSQDPREGSLISHKILWSLLMAWGFFFFQFCCLFLLVCFACKLDTWVSLYFLRIHVFWAWPNGLAVKEFIFFLLPQWDHSFCYGARLGCSYKQASVQPFSAETWASILDFSSSPSAPVEVRQMLQQSDYSVWSTRPKRLGENQVLAFFGCVAQKSRGFSTSEKSVTQHLLHSYCEEIIIIFVIVDVLLLLGRL